MLALQGDAEDAGAIVALNAPVIGAEATEELVCLHVGGESPTTLECVEVVNCAGLHAPALSNMIMSAVQKARPCPAWRAVSYTHLRAHETPEHLVCRLLLEKKKQTLPPIL
eukprot:TRINITY_DN22308_c0_g1_i2.p1 TRINITY_DN22308_c0_g1~~TRINITY_DN22308_c0_g1_i2.p1  ORF type:complete len:111 (-),score=26.19 TRINITY_DN22308_c0_g1_i2:42-374(-)